MESVTLAMCGLKGLGMDAMNNQKNASLLSDFVRLLRI